MDMRKYAGNLFLRPDDLREGPVQVTIAGVSEGRFDKPNLEFENGTKLSVNATNGRVLGRAYGFESDDWIGKRIKLVLGTIDYQGKPQESIIVEPISPPVEHKAPPMDDEIPF